MYNGILILNKPAGFTSHDAVAKLRGILRQKKIGHAGTLDPMAQGVLVMLLGSATKASNHASGQQKEYVARLRLGLVTDTQDVTGTPLEEHPVSVTEAELQSVLAQFTGRQQQLPPMYSAVQVDGRRLYDLARKGQEVDRQSREITVSKLELCSPELLAQKGLQSTPGLPGQEYDLDAVCSKGTYIRTLCHDVGQALGCGGCMAALTRVRSGAFTLEQALSFSQIEALRDADTLASAVIPTDRVFGDLPAVRLNEAGDARAIHGAFLTPEHLAEGAVPPPESGCRIYDSTGRFCMIGRSGELDRGGEAIFCDKTFFDRD